MHNIFVSLKMYAFWCANSSKKGPPAVSTCACLHYWCGRLYPSEPSAATTHTASVKTFPQSVHRNTHVLLVTAERWWHRQVQRWQRICFTNEMSLPGLVLVGFHRWAIGFNLQLMRDVPAVFCDAQPHWCMPAPTGWPDEKKKNKKQQHTSCVASISLLHCGIAKSITLLTLLSSVDLFVGSLCITKSFIELFLPLQSTKSFEKKNKKKTSI